MFPRVDNAGGTSGFRFPKRDILPTTISPPTFGLITNATAQSFSNIPWCYAIRFALDISKSLRRVSKIAFEGVREQINQ